MNQTSRLQASLARLVAPLLFAIGVGLTSGAVEAQPPTPGCVCTPPEHGEHTLILSLQALPRVDGWDEGFGHRTGGGAALGVDVRAWPAAAELHIEATYLANRRAHLWSADVGLKLPFHAGRTWELHGITGPAIAWEYGRVQQANGALERVSEPVVGVIAGLGMAFWATPHVALTLDANYRLLGGAGIAHRLYQGLGASFRL